METLPNSERLMATSAHVLFDQGNLDAVVFLLDCDLELDWSDDEGGVIFTLIGDYLTVKDFVKDCQSQRGLEGALYIALEETFNLVLSYGLYVKFLRCQIRPVEVRDNWRLELLSAIKGESVHNQAVGTDTMKINVWEGLRFRSQSEVRIAQALDRFGVLFLPNCRARLGVDGKRLNREADFLICHQGRWGILEVDGEPYHPSTRTTQDHARDRLFKSHGIVLIEHYDAQECYNHPDKVVREFLKTLASIPGK